MLDLLVNGFWIEFSLRFVHQVRDFNRVDANHCGLSALEVDSHVLLSSLLLEMCSGVRK